MQIVEGHPALEAIRAGREATDEQLLDLERTLKSELGGKLQLTADIIRKAYGIKVDSFLGLVRHLLTLDALPDYGQLVRRAFERHIAKHQYNADQIRFLRSVQEVFLEKWQLLEADLYEAPLTQFGRNAVERYFSPDEIRELLTMTNTLVA